ncbi:MAG: BMP family protein [Caldilineaceae bacterium]|nr:BMP family protein [Caldilineaceae bacterium]HRJ44396.1 BMP family protein [Caldilineaceae bacterium]
MYKRTILIAALVLALALAACAAPAPPAAAPGESAAPAQASGPFRIAIVMPSSTTDLAWSQAMFDTLKAVQAEMGGEGALEIAYSEGMFQVTDAAAAIRDYAAEGYHLVIAHGTQYGNSMFEVAVDFPETSFAWGTAVDTGSEKGLKNIFAYEASADQGGYVNGVIAALLSETNIIGVVGPVEAGDAKLYIDGFKKGVMDTKPDAVVNVSFTGSFGDTALAAEAANVHIQAGADVLTGSAQQVVGAVGIAKENGVKWLGTQSDQTSLGPDIVVANQVYAWSGVVKEIIAKVKAGELGGIAYDLTLENGGLVISYNSALPVGDDVKAAADAAIKGIEDGSITTME